MGQLIDKREIFKMRRLQADIDRANDANFHEEFADNLLLNALMRKFSPNIILPLNSEEH